MKTNIFFSNNTNLKDIEIASQVVGYIGGALVIGYNIPQLVKIIKTKSTEDISLLSIVFQFILNLVYIAYAILLGEIPIVVSESVAGIICLSIIILKKYYDKKNNKKNDKKNNNKIDKVSNVIIN